MNLSDLPVPVALDVAERLAREPARLARLPGGPEILKEAREFCRDVVELFGEVPGSVEPGTLREERLTFLLTQRVVHRALDGIVPPAGHPLAARTEIEGREHLDAAMARGRGTVVVTAHFGYPILAKLVQEGVRVPIVMAAFQRQGGDVVPLQGGAWAAVRGLRRMRATLDDNGVCVLLVDGKAGSARAHFPFFRRWTSIALGAFHLARLARAPIVPFFAVGPPGPRRFRVTFLPPLTPADGPEREAILSAAGEFVERYRRFAWQHPSHLPTHLPYSILFEGQAWPPSGARAAAAGETEAPGRRCRSAPRRPRARRRRRRGPPRPR